MKKLFAFIIMSVALVSCYDNYITDFTYTSIYFPYTLDVRTFVVGEGMKFEVGAALGGVRSNSRDRDVSYILDNSMISPAGLIRLQTAAPPYIRLPALNVTTLQQLPSAYYTNSNASTMVIKAGQHSGSVVIKADSTAFLNDSLLTKYPTYALPFRITAADADSLLYNKKTNLVGVKFENMLFGNYWHTGAAKIPKVYSPTVDSATIVYRYALNDPATKIWTLTTFGPSTLYVNGYFNVQTAKNELKLVLKGGTVFLSAGVATPGFPTTAPSFAFVQDGPCTFNQATLLQDRKLFLKYSYKNGKFTYRCTDTILFRNRIRDGINEWQDENPDHYVK